MVSALAKERRVCRNCFNKPLMLSTEILYRIVQEALQNIVQHAPAKTAHLRLYPDDAWIVLEVRDDGIGFDPTGKFPGHYGLQSMRERAIRVGGTLEIDSIPREGTRVCVRIPIR